MDSVCQKLLQVNENMTKRYVVVIVVVVIVIVVIVVIVIIG